MLNLRYKTSFPKNPSQSRQLTVSVAKSTKTKYAKLCLRICQTRQNVPSFIRSKKHLENWQ